MAVRTGMANLITRIRQMIGDGVGGSQTFSDQEVQDVLDVHRWEARYLLLKPVVTMLPGQVSQYLIWIAPSGNWEEDAALLDTQYRALTPVEANYVTGRWTLGASQEGVYLNGFSYDLYGAAADLLESWAGKMSLDYDFGVDGESYHRSQKGTALQALAASYRKKQQVQHVRQVRNDAL